MGARHAALLGAVLALPGSLFAAGTGLADDTIIPVQGQLPESLPPTLGLPAPGRRPLVVVIVDAQLLLQQSAAAQSIQRQRDSQRYEYSKEQASLEEKLIQSEQELGRLRATLPAEEFAKRRDDFERQVGEMRRLLQDRSKVLETVFNEARSRLLDEMMKVIAEVAGERQATLVLPKQLVVYWTDASLDITDIVLRRLDARLPEVAVQIPGK